MSDKDKLLKTGIPLFLLLAYSSISYFSNAEVRKAVNTLFSVLNSMFIKAPFSNNEVQKTRKTSCVSPGEGSIGVQAKFKLMANNNTASIAFNKEAEPKKPSIAFPFGLNAG
jgi:hypothetical protein